MAQAATVRTPGCTRTQSGRQPYVAQPATVCHPGAARLRTALADLLAPVRRARHRHRLRPRGRSARAGRRAAGDAGRQCICGAVLERCGLTALRPAGTCHMPHAHVHDMHMSHAHVAHVHVHAHVHAHCTCACACACTFRSGLVEGGIEYRVYGISPHDSAGIFLSVTVWWLQLN